MEAQQRRTHLIANDKLVALDKLFKERKAIGKDFLAELLLGLGLLVLGNVEGKRDDLGHDINVGLDKLIGKECLFVIAAIKV